MSAFDKPIIVQQIDEQTERWGDLWKLHSRVNKTKGSEYYNAGVQQSKASLTFEVRYFKALETIRLNTQSYRIHYRGRPYDIVDYDDYQESHLTVKLMGVSGNG